MQSPRHKTSARKLARKQPTRRIERNLLAVLKRMSVTGHLVAGDCAQRSDEGTIDVGSVVRALGQASVESYFTDYRRGEHTYYAPGGETHALALPLPDIAIANAFDADAVNQAVRGAQSGGVNYAEFVSRTMAAGCIGLVWIAGRQLQYFGRRGEVHVERFPQ